MSFKNIIFPTPPKIDKNGEMIPLEFYGIVVPNSIKIQFKLGYFSTNAISTLAPGFAKFIYNGGTAEFMINHFLNPKDYDLLVNKNSFDNIDYDLIKSKIEDLNELQAILIDQSKNHFFNCLRFLLLEEKLKIIPVMCSDGEMSHYKEAIFTDKQGDKIYINGSCNFTQAGILDNGESFLVHMNWKNKDDELLINASQINFDKIFSKKDEENFIYLEVDRLEKVILENSVDKNLLELLDDEIVLRRRLLNVSKIDEIKKRQQEQLINEIEEIKKTPRFPYGKPREYQNIAYERWCKNNRKGLFAMATGTGKTITSLNCIYEDWKLNNYYRVLILVPTTALANQWKKECLNNFNFINTLVTNQDQKWEIEIKATASAIKSGVNVSFILITTYALFKRSNFQDILLRFGDKQETITLIADEAHTIGSPGSVNLMPAKIINRIGLSATPERNFDTLGSKAIESYFNAEPPKYTICYTMKKAIDNGILSSFNYYPKFCSLNEVELKEYIKITSQLQNYLDSKTGKYKDLPEVTNLLILRKHIVHKAKAKLNVFERIITHDIGVNSVKNMFVYAPEGFEPKYWEGDRGDYDFEDEEKRLIDSYVEIIGKKNIPVFKFTGGVQNKESILNLFTKEKYRALVAMKCLDEGIDIPQAEYAIFCSSTGNPRQFIQRRGRVLRKYGEKKAKIFDIIVAPDFEMMYEISQQQLNAEKNVFKSELLRIINFAAIADNRTEIVEHELGDICKNIGIDNLLELMNYEYNRQNIEL